jgi:uncharacterized protein (TIGR01777 family)
VVDAGTSPRILGCHTFLDVRVGVTGSHGLIGSALISRLSASGHAIVRLVRSDPAPEDIEWDPGAGRLDPDALAGVDAVINLAGPGIGDHRWTDAYKHEIRDARVRATALVAETIASRDDGPRVLLSASGIDYYGDHGGEELDESSPNGASFLASLCREWEAATGPAEAAGVRVVHLRSGMVLSAAGGALRKLLPLFKLGFGGRFGSGNQWVSWISIDDELAAIEHLLTSDVHGPANLTAPSPVTNAEFAKTLGRVLHRPAVVPVPRFGPSLIAGREAAEALLYTGRRVLPRVLKADGFTHAHPDLETALRAVLNG